MGMLIILVIIGLIVYFMKKGIDNKIIRSNSKGLKWLFLGYLSILVLSVPVAFLLPIETESLKGEIAKGDVVHEQDIYIEDALLKGEIEELVDKNKTELWAFDYENDVLNIEQKAEEFYVAVYLEETSEYTEMIEATYFYPRLIVDEWDFSNEVSPIRVELKNNSLNIYEPLSVTINHGEFEMGFPMSQFYGESKMMGRSSSSSMGGQILYLKVPEGLEIGDDTNVDIIKVE
ncbi:hypothetical protein CR203_11890 [Salipaludibacillus neizhouensis]|uniref:Uncharacterized protein n=1 Tax=Salipaludibacillus neizhouensis TaxID=885475 RepID=A0A3A9KC62_9BACI|nr:hypothetical protein [Salipaludibacillus neizhouensis]RKL67203.1 hypothetical protein CR203_11890 [Salipaludibacillus neizhouensis]